MAPPFICGYTYRIDLTTASFYQTSRTWGLSSSISRDKYVGQGLGLRRSWSWLSPRPAAMDSSGLILDNRSILDKSSPLRGHRLYKSNGTGQKPDEHTMDLERWAEVSWVMGFTTEPP